MARLTRKAFRAALAKGQGRAWLHVRKHGTAGVEADLLHACLHNLLYDAQCEDSRAAWLLEMVDRSPNRHHFAAVIAVALPTAEDDHDAWQLGDLALLLARKGAREAREALYARLETSPPDRHDGAENVLELDGLQGFLRAAEMRGRKLLADPAYWEDHMLFDLAVEHRGKFLGFTLNGTASAREKVRAALNKAASGSKAVRAYRKAVKESLKRREKPRDSRAGLDLATILKDIEAAAGTSPGKYTWFGRIATQEDADAVFARLLAETRRDQQLRCLWVFRRRAVPRVEDVLLQLAESTDTDLQDAACSALAGTRDPRLRALALRLLERPESLPHSGLRLFRANLEEGDPVRIEAALWVPEDRREAHSIAWDLLELAGENPKADLAGCLLWAAEHTPCSMCRARALRHLIQRGQAPKKLLRQCLHDADEEARKLAAEELGAVDGPERNPNLARGDHPKHR